MHFIMFQEKKLFRKGVANVFGEGSQVAHLQ